MARGLPRAASVPKPGKISASLTKLVKLKPTTKLNFNPSQFLGARSTAQSAAEGRLKVAASSQYKAKRSSLKKSVAKKKKAVPFINISQ